MHMSTLAGGLGIERVPAVFQAVLVLPPQVPHEFAHMHMRLQVCPGTMSMRLSFSQAPLQKVRPAVLWGVQHSAPAHTCDAA